MANQHQNNLKLGIFIISGLLVFLFFIIMVSKKRDLFGSEFELKTRFSNLNGLSTGDNVLFSGLQAGSVKRITLVNDTTIEVDLSIDEKLRSFIPKNTTAAVITNGFVGDKVVNLVPGKGISAHVSDGDLLQPAIAINKEDELKTLSRTNSNIMAISEVLKGGIGRIDTSALINLLDNRKVAGYLLSALQNLDAASNNAKALTTALNSLVGNAKHGHGVLGALLTDSSDANDLKAAIANIKTTTIASSNAANQLNEAVGSFRQDIEAGNGPLHVLLKDTATADNLAATITNLKNGTLSFSQDMDALKHNFFLRGYFKRQEKQDEKVKTQQAKAARDSARLRDPANIF
jgi:phospholipid/cholesterol/gamma-HCH transport system substrate-binding protein